MLTKTPSSKPPFTKGGNLRNEIAMNARLVQEQPFTTPSDDPPAADSPLVKLLKSGRVPERGKVRSWI